MKQTLRTYSALTLGIILVIAGIVTHFIPNETEVPNDPNIGGGILVMCGVILAGAGGAVVWSARRDRRDAARAQLGAERGRER